MSGCAAAKCLSTGPWTECQHTSNAPRRHQIFSMTLMGAPSHLRIAPCRLVQQPPTMWADCALVLHGLHLTSIAVPCLVSLTCTYS